MEAIFTRRSIRKFTCRRVPEEALLEVIRAAAAAPSAGNEQPWHFVIIDQRKTLDSVPHYHPHAEMMREAQAAVVICSDLRMDKHDGMWVQDCSAATQNLLLAAHAQGLGAVWVGLYPREDRVAKTRALLRLPDNVVPFAIVPLGFPAESKAADDRFRLDRIHRNKWQG